MTSEDAASEKTMTRLRPKISENAPAPIIATASTALATDSERLATAGETANSRANTGISGCTLYSSAKVEKPPRNKGPVTRQNAASEREILGRLGRGWGESPEDMRAS